MNWLSETTHKSGNLPTGEPYEYHHTRCWIDAIDIDHFKVTVECNNIQRNDEKPEVFCTLYVNGEKIKEQYVRTFDDAKDYGKDLINQMKEGIACIL